MAVEGTLRKRRRVTPNDPDDESKKPRGRPRVDGQNATAADRRRTQIRLAQRAYRQRKENTISGLQDQVSALRSTIEEMNRSFLTFNEKVMSANLLHGSSELAMELRNTTHQFLHLVKSSEKAPSSSGESDTDSNSRQQPYQERQLRNVSQERQDLYSRQVDIGLGYVQIVDESGSSSNEDSAAMADVLSSANVMDNTIGDLIRLGGSQSPLNNFDGEFPSVASPVGPKSPANVIASDYQEVTPSTALQSMSLKAPYTYSIEESTFARRLQRSALERAYHILATAQQRPAAYTRVFRLSLLYNTRETLMTKVRQVLTQPVNSPLEHYHSPFYNLGGAGTHYGTGRKQNAYVIKFGPLDRRAVLHHVETGNTTEVRIDFDPKEYEGEWFDSNDVEGYLKDLGLAMSPRGTFAEVQVPSNGPLIQLLKKSSIIPIADTPSPPSWTSSTPSLQMEPATTEDGASRLFPELGLADSSSHPWSRGMKDATNWLLGAGDRTPEFLSSGWMGVQDPSTWDISDSLGLAFSGPVPISQQEPEFTRKITLDVANFIDEMIKTGICLGRSPGFRKKDVERSLLASIIEVV